ncbi:triphosphoribosyl-dephospho-CoA synthase [Klebsiella pneumoniae]|nr:triphosphoribosyl-dephospho-CoA synthase [Klebsiella pneumoniae]
MSDVLINPARVRRVKPLSAEEVVSAVERALLTEVRLTPKPGLVDIRNAGAHWDMDLASFEASTRWWLRGWRNFSSWATILRRSRRSRY